MVATVSDGRALLTAEDAVRPDVVVTNIMMPGLDGITATAALMARCPGTRVVPGMVYHGPLFGEVWLRGGRPRSLQLTPTDELQPAVPAVMWSEWCRSPRLRNRPV